MYKYLVYFLLLIKYIDCQQLSPSVLSNHRIIGGTPALLGEVPHQISIQYPIENVYIHICGGALIRESHVLTAAHCVYIQIDTSGNIQIVSPVSILRLVAGVTRYNATTPQTRNPILISAYSSYRPNSSFDHDIALIKVSSPFVMTSYTVKLIPYRRTETPDEEKCIVSGWGSTAEGGGSSVDLMTIFVDIVKPDDCKLVYRDDLTKNMVCAGGTTGVGVCQGDSGGALVCGGQLTGLASFSIGCARPGIPAVYTEVARYISWIDSQSSADKLKYSATLMLSILSLTRYFVH